jgi:hypothetical protein
VRRYLYLPLALLLLVPLIAVAAPPSTVVYPPQELAMSYSHALHAKRGAVDCTLCHKGAAKSASAADRLMPEERDCEGAGCHTIERFLGKGCNECHPGWNGEGSAPAVIVPPPNLKFPHSLHKGACTSCHGGDPEKTGVGMMTRADLPSMASCASCHDGKQASARCTTCHPGDAAGRMKTRFAEGDLVPEADHPPDVRTNHGRAARADAKSCASCHSKQMCVDCHDGRTKPLDFHAGDYATSHGVDARRNTPDCASCHRAQTFCTGCHARTGVTTDKRTSNFGAATTTWFHPQAWHTASNHGPEARRNLRACASCHRESFCIGCHAEGRPGATGPVVNPHGAGWNGSRRCETLRSKNPRVCVRCHPPGYPCDEDEEAGE